MIFGSLGHKRRVQTFPVTERHTNRDALDAIAQCSLSFRKFPKILPTIHTIFEGTSEIQQLVIARAISGLRVE